VTGERREESRHRATLPELEPHKRLTVGAREVDSWRPILGYRLADVWAHIAATGLPRHVAYDRGNERLSCAICVLASDNDIRNGAAECQALAAKYLAIERETGHTFRHGRRLADILSPNTGLSGDQKET
jgi:3'-phosphoadenosine 5'-phosphosulfate sulfotransferase (PAPS reductase)/FAD synthetase